MFLSNRKNLLILIAVFAVTAVLLVPQVVQAWSGVDTLIVNAISWIAQAIIYVVGQLLLIAINILIKIASFNEFVDANAVNIGWVIIRDIANMAIVVALLVIAFYTVLNKQSYHFKTMLPKLVIAAILVNFSKTIAGLFIDVGQVVMMTFVHAFEKIAAGNLTYGFGLQDLLSVRNAAEAAGKGVDDWSVLGALALGAIMVIIALGVIVSMIVMLLWRVVMLWILIIFSPIAYVAQLLPGGSRYANDWWQNFTKYIVFGPALAFMFWLSMSVISNVTTHNRVMNLELEQQKYLESKGGATVDYAYFASQVSSPQKVFDYMVTCALLIACLIFAQQSGVMGAQVAGNFYGKIQSAGSWIQRKAQGAVTGIAKLPVKPAGALWRKTNIPHMARALGKRIQTSRAGKWTGLDKEYKERLEAERRARWEERIGGKKEAIRRNQLIRAREVAKELEESGAFQSKHSILDTLRKATDKGELDKAMAALNKAAEKKILTPELAKRFEEKFAGKPGSAQEQRILGYSNAAWDTQAAAGDEAVAFKRTVKAGEFGYSRRSPKDAVEEVKKVKGSQETRDVASTGTVKAMLASKKDNKAANEVFNILASPDRNDLGRITDQNKKGVIKRGLEVLAEDNKKPFLDETTRKNIRKVVNTLQAIDTGIVKYDPRTGRIIDEKDMKMISDATESGSLFIRDKKTGEAELLEGEEVEKYLSEIYKDAEKAEVETAKEKRILGTLEETKVGERVKKKIIPKISLSDEMNNIYRYRSEIASQEDEKKWRDIAGNMENEMRNSILPYIESQIRQSKIDIINPNTGRKYTGDDLVKEFMNSEAGKNLSKLASKGFAENEKQVILNALDNLIIDLQDTSNWKKILKQVIKDKLKGLRNTPKARQKARQQTLISARRLKTNLDELEKPQTKPKLYALGRKTTKEMRRVKETLKDLAESAQFISDKAFNESIKEFNKQYDIYKKSTDETKDKTKREKALEEMKKIVQDILSRFEVK